MQLFLESWNRCLLGAFKRNLNQITLLKLGASRPQLGKKFGCDILYVGRMVS